MLPRIKYAASLLLSHTPSSRLLYISSPPHRQDPSGSVCGSAQLRCVVSAIAASTHYQRPLLFSRGRQRLCRTLLREQGQLVYGPPAPPNDVDIGAACLVLTFEQIIRIDCIAAFSTQTFTHLTQTRVPPRPTPYHAELLQRTRIVYRGLKSRCSQSKPRRSLLFGRSANYTEDIGPAADRYFQMRVEC